ncbi:restriction endonuclease subunit S [Pseudarthrobacter sp. YS3]|uniref:restriction endonuclease subunit S n=1 Tax=Pseudarthrobacter sp. YS3 TaxID=3453718 RepID=UPI003EEC419E
MSTTVSPSRAIKHVGNRWLGEVPEDWSITRLRFVCDVATGSGDTQDAEPHGEYDFYVRSPKPLRSTGFTFNTEAVLTAGDGAVGEVFHHVRGKFHAHQRVYVLTNFREVLPRYFFYYFSSFFRLMAQDGSARTTVDSVRRWMLTDMPFVLPPVDEQRAIAEYLDHETAQIDALVAKQEEFVGLLRERRSRAREVLADRVAVGARLRWMLREIDHRAGSRAADLSLFSVSIDWGVRRRTETTDKLSRAEDLSHYKVCLEGDIVVNRMRAFQGALGVAPSDGMVSPDYAVLRAAPEADPSWLAELMRTKAFIGEITLRLRGIGGTDSGNVRTPRINTADLLDIRADVPDATTQGMELTNLVAETTRIDALLAKTKEHIALAKERRSALISAAVTGQIDVRTARKVA